MKERVCISGGTGLIGTAISQVLTRSRYSVSYLSRKKQNGDERNIINWNIQKQTLQPGGLDSVDHIIHLAGESIASGRWTVERKKRIRESRIQSTRLLYDTLKNMESRPRTFVAASAVGVYGHHTGGVWVDEERNKPGDDFLATVTREWETESQKIRELGIRVVILRMGIVLSKSGGALPKFLMPIKMGVGAPLGNGDQYISWIDIDDLARIFEYGLENHSMDGIYNAVAPDPKTNKEFTRELARKLNKPLILPPVPAFAIRMAMGEMSSMVLGGNRVSSKKIQDAGFRFLYPDLMSSLNHLIE